MASHHGGGSQYVIKQESTISVTAAQVAAAAEKRLDPQLVTKEYSQDVGNYTSKGRKGERHRDYDQTGGLGSWLSGFLTGQSAPMYGNSPPRALQATITINGQSFRLEDLIVKLDQSEKAVQSLRIAVQEKDRDRQELESKMKDFKELKVINKGWQEAYQKQETTIERLKLKRSEAEGQVKQLEAIQATTVSDLKDSQSLNSELKCVITEQNDLIRQAQDVVMVTNTTSLVEPEDDDSVRSRLQRVTSQWKQFAKTWGLRSIDEVAKEHNSLMVEISESHRLDEDAPDGLFSPENRAKAAHMLLNAELAHFLAANIVNEPFTSAFGTDGTEETSSSLAAMRVFREVWQRSRQVDVATANLWRAQTVALLGSHKARVPEPLKQKASEKRRQYYEFTADRFEKSRARCLLRPVSNFDLFERRKRLLEIIVETGELFASLWTQRVEIGTCDNRQWRGKPFRISSRDFVPHASHKLEETDTSLDGIPIHFVVQPTIVAFGNEQGQAYNSYKVWSRGVVWLKEGDGSKGGRPDKGRN